MQALNTGGFAEVVSVSCSSAGNCAAGGDYSNGPGGDDVREFVVSEQNGRWGRAAEIRGLGGLNAGADAQDMSLSCGSAGNCAAGGEYLDGSGNYQGFAVVERNGRWGKATGVPGLGALNAGGVAEVDDVSCVSASSCAAGGFYTDRRRFEQGFVVSERNGRWAKATEVPGLDALNAGGDAAVFSVSCAPAGNCAAGGRYKSSRRRQGFVVAERNGRWAKATGVPGLDALNTAGDAAVFSVSCATAGNCAAGGYYQDAPDDEQGFVVSERNGRWAKATPIPGLQALNTGGSAQVSSVSCGPAGPCTAGGFYTERSVVSQGFLVSRSG